MDLFANIESLRRSLDYHLERHSVLASNIANAETPGYRSLDMSFDAYLAQAEKLQATDEGSQALGADPDYQVEVFDDSPGAANLDGNTVSTEREMAKIGANSVRYNTNLEILSRRLAVIRYAASDGQRK